MNPEPPPVSLPEHNDSWFNKEVQPHAASLRAYLFHRFPSVSDIEDIIQESFLRIWKRRTAGPILSSKAFLFTVARNMALDFVRRRQISPIIPGRDPCVMNVKDNGQDAAESADTNEKVLALADAVAALPTRCREIIILHKFEGLSQKEVAERFAISERTVEVQVARGVRRCESYLRRHGFTSFHHHEG